jgi:hypothetical protein
LFSDAEVAKEMDVPAVEATRSYRCWLALPEGGEFVYNQKYIKGRDGHDWLLRKNIWRRMRYRRENKKMVEHMRVTTVHPVDSRRLMVASQIVDQTLLTTMNAPTSSSTTILHHHHHHHHEATTSTTTTSTAAAENTSKNTNSIKQDNSNHTTVDDNDNFEVSAAVEAAVAVAESYVKSSPYNTHHHSLVHNPLEHATANPAALDAAARLAAATVVDDDAVAAAAAATAPKQETQGGSTVII